MLTESTLPTSSTIQIASYFAAILSLMIALGSGALGALASWWLNGREMRRAKSELDQIRVVRDSAQNVRQQAINERERAIRELHGKVQEFGMIETEAASLRRQLDQAKASLNTNESQLEELKSMVRATKRQSEEAQTELTSMEEQWTTKNQSIIRLQTQVRDLSGALDEARKQLNERYLTITAMHAQLQEYRSRATESTSVVSSLQSAFSELSRRLQQQTVKMADTDIRQNDLEFQSTISAEVPLIKSRTDMPTAETAVRSDAGIPSFMSASSLRSNSQESDASISKLENKLVAMLSEFKTA